MANKASKGKKEIKFYKFMLSTFTILSRVAYFYMKCMEECSNSVGQGALGLYPGPQVSRFPKSVNTFNHAPKGRDGTEELLRSVSKRKNVSLVELNGEVIKGDILGSGGVRIVRRSVGGGNLGRIDEE